MYIQFIHVCVSCMCIQYMYMCVEACLSIYVMQPAQVLLFFKYYDPISRTITYIGHSVEPLATEFRECDYTLDEITLHCM